MNTCVIYHRADFDGLFSREVARRFYGERAQYIGWDYGDPVPSIPSGAELVMIDISVDGLMDWPGLIWIDHHRSAIEKYDRGIAGYRIDGVAACRLAWQWFFRRPRTEPLPSLAAYGYYAERLDEPLAVRLVGLYDVWDKTDSRAELFQHGLRTPDGEPDWKRLLDDDRGYVAELLRAGEVLQRVRARENASIIKQQGFTLQFEGLTFLACNAARYNSLLFTAGLQPEHDGCLGFNWDGRKGRWRISLYGVPGKPDVDLSAIAVRYGGGGHKQACGFECLTLPFALEGGGS